MVVKIENINKVLVFNKVKESKLRTIKDITGLS